MLLHLSKLLMTLSSISLSKAQFITSAPFLEPRTPFREITKWFMAIMWRFTIFVTVVGGMLV